MALTKIPANLLSGVDLPDSTRLNLGSDNDLALFHTGGNGVIHNTTGALRIRANTFNIQDYTNEDAMITAISDGAVSLYHNNSKKFETTSGGASITGNLAVSGNLTVSGTTTEISTTNLQVEDKNIVLNYGSGDTSSNADGAGITIQDAVDASNDATFTWDATNDEFDFSHKINVASITVGDGHTIGNDGDDNLALASSAGENIIIDSADDIILDADGGDWIFRDGGTEKIRFKDEKIGIGINPSEMLDIQSNSGDARIRLDAPSGSDTEIKFFNAASAQYTIGHDDATDNFVIGGANVDTPLVVVNKSNYVGIGTTSMDSLLHTKATNNSAGDLYTQIGPGNAPGITIQNAGTTDNNNAALFFKNDSGTRASISAKFKSHSNDETDLVFSTTDTSGNARERIYLTTNSQSGADFIGKEGPNALSTSAGDNWHLHSDRAMSVIQDDNNASNYIVMKSFRPSTNGRSLSIKWAAKNQSGSYWWRWRITRNGSVMKKSDQSTDAQGEYYEGLASGESASVHAFRSFDVDVGEFHAGDVIKLEMVNSNGAGSPVAGTQYLYAKQFEVLDLGYGKPQGTYFGVVREPAVWGSIHMTGSNGNQYTKGSMRIPVYFDSGTHNIIELAEYDQATTSVAILDYVGLYGYAGTSQVLGTTLTSTRRVSSNSAWGDIDGATDLASGSTAYAPDFYWANGVLKIGVASSVQITGEIRVIWHNATIQRYYQP